MRINSDLVLKSVFSGVILAIASTVNLLAPNRLAGAFLFSVGLTAIFALGAFLYTGAVGSAIVRHERGFLPWLLVMLGGNLLGCLASAGLMMCIDMGADVSDAALASWAAKTSQSQLSAFISAAFCGFLVYTAWKANARAKERPVITTFVIVLCVMVFVFCGFDHSIANSYLLFVSGSFDGMSLWYLVLMILGNSVGAVAPAYIFRS